MAGVFVADRYAGPPGALLGEWGEYGAWPEHQLGPVARGLLDDALGDRSALDAQLPTGPPALDVPSVLETTSRRVPKGRRGATAGSAEGGAKLPALPGGTAGGISRVGEHPPYQRVEVGLRSDRYVAACGLDTPIVPRDGSTTEGRPVVRSRDPARGVAEQVAEDVADHRAEEVLSARDAGRRSGHSAHRLSSACSAASAAARTSDSVPVR